MKKIKKQKPVSVIVKYRGDKYISGGKLSHDGESMAFYPENQESFKINGIKIPAKLMEAELIANPLYPISIREGIIKYQREEGIGCLNLKIQILHPVTFEVIIPNKGEAPGRSKRPSGKKTSARRGGDV